MTAASIPAVPNQRRWARHVDAIASHPLAAALALVTLTTALRLTGSVDTDVSWQLWIAGRMHAGARLYRDIIEVNPPLWFWMALPVDRVATLLHANVDKVLIVGIGLLAALSLAATNKLSHFGRPRSAAARLRRGRADGDAVDAGRPARATRPDRHRALCGADRRAPRGSAGAGLAGSSGGDRGRARICAEALFPGRPDPARTVAAALATQAMARGPAGDGRDRCGRRWPMRPRSCCSHRTS